MSTDITKKQHYVWRWYLGSWKNSPNDKRIWTGFLQTGEVKKVALMSVAQSNYFYKLVELTDEEFGFLRQYMKKLSPHVRGVANAILAGYEMFTQIKKSIAAGDIEANAVVNHQVLKIEADTFESIQTQIENMGEGLLSCKSINEIEQLVKEDGSDILFFLMVQYLRTKSMKERFVKSLSERKHLQTIGHKCWPFFNFVSALQIVEVMALRNDYRFTLVNNKCQIPFITGDQPVFNALEDITDENGDVIGLELYYPMSPQSALTVSFTPGKRFEEKDADESFVVSRNELIRKQSLIHIFANSEEVLKRYINTTS